jgi:hypothetical protein
MRFILGRWVGDGKGYLSHQDHPAAKELPGVLVNFQSKSNCAT